MHLAWAAYYEGGSDRAYFDVLLPRIMEEITLSDGLRQVSIPNAAAVHLGLKNREVAAVAAEACANAEAFHLLFIHADSGGRAQSSSLDSRGKAYCAAVEARCSLRSARCIVMEPRHETEAWVMADPDAVLGALGFRGGRQALALPADADEAERLVDPKATLKNAVNAVRNRRACRGDADLFTAIAQRQAIDRLRGAASFRSFEGALRGGLADLGCIAPS
ncbi:MAG: DUF4276 family protein [Magnetospirillum sp. WYHS-4]